jgi:deoxyribodipyrimidine photo-lyase
LKTLHPDDLVDLSTEEHYAALTASKKSKHQHIPSLQQLGFYLSNQERIALPAGEEGAHQLLESFLSRLSHYHEKRDFPAIKGPSYLSVHLRFGAISLRKLVRIAHSAMLRGDQGAQAWLNKLM